MSTHKILVYSSALIGLAVEFSWAVGESVVLPYLQWLGVPDALLGFLFVLNPMMVLLIHPYVAFWSDKLDRNSVLGRRIPFILACAVVGAVGILLIAYSLSIASGFKPSSSRLIEEAGDATNKTSHKILANSPAQDNLQHAVNEIASIAIPITFFGYFLLDVSNDILVAFGRTAAIDWGANPTERRHIHQRCTVFQMFGRCLSFAAGTLRVGRAAQGETRAVTRIQDSVDVFITSLSSSQMPFLKEAVSVFNKICHKEDRCIHMHTMVFASGFLTLAIVSIVTIARVMITFTKSLKKEDCAELGETAPLLGEKSDVSSPNNGTHHGQDDENSEDDYFDDEEEAATCTASAFSLLKEHRLFALVLVAHCVGWCVMMYQSFFWTVWIENSSVNVFGWVMRTSFAGLFGQAVAALAMSIALPRFNKKVGRVNLYFIGEFAMMSSLIVIWFLGNGKYSVLSAILLGPSYAIHQNNGFTVAFALLQTGNVSNERGMVVALVNSMMPLAQIIVGSFFALIVDSVFQGDPGIFFFCLGAIGIAIDALVVFSFQCFKKQKQGKDGW